ncbi:hypothetical protein [Enterocloster clostridioformis]|jgi:hypothetical protein|nr:hypothetical protein [Enterocloster clostridioformis]
MERSRMYWDIMGGGYFETMQQEQLAAMEVPPHGTWCDNREKQKNAQSLSVGISLPRTVHF